MAKEIDKIIQSKTAPKSNNVLWDNGENLKIYRNGKWENTGGGSPMVNISYTELVALRDGSKLIAGQMYRITDYVTTTAQENTRSAGHQFDVIVTADNENTLNEVARACLHDGDTYFSEAGANLAAWQIWYSLDNDAERFAWADAENGKGVIYRMIDEWNNDIPYDFKNILFVDMKNSKISAEANYYGTWWAGELVRNTSADKQIGPNSYRYAWILTKVSGPGSNGIWYTDSDSIQSVDTIFYEYDSSNFSVSETIRIINLAIGQAQYTFGNALSPDNELTEFVDYSIGEKNCYNNIIKPMLYEASNQVLNAVLFGSNCYSNSFGDGCYNNSFGSNCSSNSFGSNCSSNSFGSSSQCNELKAYYCYITLGEGVQHVTLLNETEGDYKNQVQNYRVANGTHGKGGNPLVVDVTRNREYETFVGMNSNDELKVFCLADLAN